MGSKLVDMELDEISLVKKGANQFSTVAIAKSLQGEEEDMDLFDEDGNVIDPEELELGDVVFDAEGTAYEYTDEDDDVDADDRELEAVGKAFGGGLGNAAKKFGAAAKDKAKKGTAGAGNFVRQNPTGAAAAGGALGGFAAGAGFGHGLGRRNEVGKSFDLREEFSKALTDDDRDAVISKAFNEIEELKAANEEALEIAKAEQETRIYNEYVSIAKTYTLPYEDEVIAKTMMEAEASLSDEACAVIAKAFELASDLITQEIGFEGVGSNGMEGVGDALEEIGKSVDDPEAIAKLLEEHPELYDDYEASKY